MKRLSKNQPGSIIIKPRWPYRYVYISNNTYEKLMAAQEQLQKYNVQIVLTRGFENEGSLKKSLHTLGRRTGAVIFTFIFPQRQNEIKDIFSANGHDVDGDSIDVGIIADGKPLNLLPYGVLTTTTQITNIRNAHRQILDTVWDALQACGFSIHPNKIEALQIHCENGVPKCAQNEN
jgi:hypothetical protein